MKTGYFVYILECADGSLYTGYTTNIEERVKTHNSGKGAKYTKGRLPVKLVYSEQFADKSSALSREWHIKHKMTRKDKLELIKHAPV
ncbi:MAG: GIY-YIG nuclease family protein [Lachnospiraceae bacterium]|nr:GIY-YIG nuclease family protein [Lachnospiraceae bacterium]